VPPWGSLSGCVVALAAGIGLGRRGGVGQRPGQSVGLGLVEGQDAQPQRRSRCGPSIPFTAPEHSRPGGEFVNSASHDCVRVRPPALRCRDVLGRRADQSDDPRTDVRRVGAREEHDTEHRDGAAAQLEALAARVIRERVGGVVDRSG
jgi:hypothetical protein